MKTPIRELGPGLRRSCRLVLVVIGALAFSSASQGALPILETSPMNGSGDIADDVALWLHPTDSSKSVLLGTNKATGAAGGLYAFDLNGGKFGAAATWNSSNWYSQGKRINTVDLSYNFHAGDELWDIVSVSNRTDDHVEFFRIDRTPVGDFSGLTSVGSVSMTVLGAVAGEQPYGNTLFHSGSTGKHFLIANSVNGNAAQWELAYNSDTNQIHGQQVWFADLTPGVNSEVEGVVADDERGVVYFAAEDFALYRYSTVGGIIQDTGRVTVDTAGSGGHLAADIEGLTIYYGSNGAGYLMASSQGSNNFHVYERGFSPNAPNAHVGSFAITAGNGVDAVSSTDGIAVFNSNLGGSLASGLFVAHDGSGDSPTNYKLVPWGDVADDFNPGLVVDTTWNPRVLTQAIPPMFADATVTPLHPFPITATTGEKAQSKLWMHDGQWWSVMPDSTGTWIRRLDGDTWQPHLRLSTVTSYTADVLADGDLVHVLLQSGSNSRLASLEYSNESDTYGFWSARPTLTSVPLASSTELATIALDASGRLWVASDNKSSLGIEVRHSEGSFTSFSSPITIGTGINVDDIAAITRLPDGSVGVMWSNQNTQRFHFRQHFDSSSPTDWSAIETAAPQSAQGKGNGMADDHINFAVASDGTLYAAVKTGYDSSGFTEIGLLVRRPTGEWDNIYHVDFTGTRPIVLLDESLNRLLVAFTSAHGGNADIVYRESPLDNISFSERRLLLKGALSNVTSTKQTLSGQVVLMASDFPSTGISAAYSVLLSYATGIPGDYNSDGRVDSADYIVWRRYMGTDFRLSNDPIGGTIGTEQYDLWKSNFGATNADISLSQPSRVIPEPSSVAQVTIGAVVISMFGYQRISSERPCQPTNFSIR